MGTNLIPEIIISLERPESGRMVPFLRIVQRFKPDYQIPMHQAWSSDGLLRFSLGHLDPQAQQETARAVFSAYVRTLHESPRDDKRLARSANLFLSFDDYSIDWILRSMNDSDPAIRAGAASLVGYQGGMPADLFEAVAKLIHDPDKTVRSHAFNALARHRKGAAMVVPLLVQGLDDPDSAVRFSAAHGLMRFGGQSRIAAPKLIEMMEREPHTRKIITDFLQQIGVDPSHRDSVQ